MFYKRFIRNLFSFDYDVLFIFTVHDIQVRLDLLILKYLFTFVFLIKFWSSD
jgi:hypothetical protein